MKVEDVITRLKSGANPTQAASMEFLGLCGEKVFGVSPQVMNEIADEIGTVGADFADALWNTGYYEAKMIACLVVDPASIPKEQADRWTEEFDSWMLCDQCCAKLFWRTPFAMEAAVEWSERYDEFVRRAGFTLIGNLARWVEDKSAPRMFGFLDYSLFLARKHAADSRLQVRGAISMALSRIGGRSESWRDAAMEAIDEIRMQPSRDAKWVASQAVANMAGSRDSFGGGVGIC